MLLAKLENIKTILSQKRLFNFIIYVKKLSEYTKGCCLFSEGVKIELGLVG